MTKKKADTNVSDQNTSVLDTPVSSPGSPPVTRTPKRKMNKSKRLTLTPQKTAAGVKKRKPRNILMRVGIKTFKLSRKILREIKHYQLTTGNLIPKLPFSRLIQELVRMSSPQLRIQKQALIALQEAAEMHLVQYFQDSYVCTLHARRCTLIPRDMEVVQHLRRE